MNQSAAPQTWDLDAVARASDARQEPLWLRQQRQQAFQLYHETPPAYWDRNQLPFLWERLQWQAARGQSAPAGTQLRLISPEPTLLPPGVIVTDLVQAVRQHPDLVRRYLFASALPLGDERVTDSHTVALQACLWQNGLFVYVPARVKVELPLTVARGPGLGVPTDPHADRTGESVGGPIAKDGWVQAQLEHTLIVLGEGASLDFVQQDQEASQPGAVTLSASGEASGHFLGQSWEVYLGAGAHLRAAFVQDLPSWLGANPEQARPVYALRTGRILLEQDSQLELIEAEMGTAWARSQWTTELVGEGATATAYGLFFGVGNQRLDLGLALSNRAAHTKAEMVVRGVVAGRAQGVFHGLGYVHQAAPASSNNQQTAALVLNKNARADVVPSLKIDEDEVQAGHGAAVGQVDEEALFYLMSRGLSRTQATRLMVEGFLTAWWDRLPLPQVRAVLQERSLQKLGG